ncbi:glycosyltransferase family 4 protein [Thermogladius sp. 4427co]|uniref:glycosyltransferase family 4 protein n=1 Tax=Thermogladius sp. 4427co TaxID=3450718 RepID=UPI003F7B097C
MKIVHVIHHYWPIVGGIENVVKALAEGMAKLGHEVHVITSTYGAENRPREEVINGVYIHRVKSLRLYSPDLTYPLEIPKNILRDADIVHGHSQNSLFAVKIVEEAKKLGVKTAMHFMAVDAFGNYPNPFIRPLASYYGRLCVRKAISVSDIKLAKSLRDINILETMFDVRALYVPDGIDKNLLEIPSMAEEFQRKYGLHKPFIVYIGRLHKLKGVDILIKAMSIAIKEDPELYAVIIGPGEQRPYRELAKRLGVEGNVLFLGFVNEKTKIGAIDSSIALVLPSICDYVEVYSLVVSEAWARGKPVIASSVGEIPYRVKHMVNGLLVPPRNPKALAETIIAIAQDKKLSRKLGLEGKKQVVVWDEVISKLLVLYTS